MKNVHFVDGIIVPDLGKGSALLIWCVRSAFHGTAQPCCIACAFLKHLGPDGGPELLRDIIQFSRNLKAIAPKPLDIGAPSCFRMTDDEASLIWIFSTSQSGEKKTRDALFFDLFHRPPNIGEADAIDSISWSFLKRGTLLNPPVPTQTNVLPG